MNGAQVEASELEAMCRSVALSHERQSSVPRLYAPAAACITVTSDLDAVGAGAPQAEEKPGDEKTQARLLPAIADGAGEDAAPAMASAKESRVHFGLEPAEPEPEADQTSQAVTFSAAGDSAAAPNDAHHMHTHLHLHLPHAVSFAFGCLGKVVNFACVHCEPILFCCS